MEEIEFKRTTYYTGRNGFAKQIGLMAADCDNDIELFPINTNGVAYNTFIRIPVEDIDQLIKALRKIKSHNKISEK